MFALRTGFDTRQTVRDCKINGLIIAQLKVQTGMMFPLSDSQLEAWKAAGGYQRSEWDAFKKELAGSMDVFGKLEQAANTQSRYYVHDA